MVNCTASRYCTVIFMALVAFPYLSCCSGAQGLGDFVHFGYFSVSNDVDSLELAYNYFHESSGSQDLRLIGSLQRDGDYVITLI